MDGESAPDEVETPMEDSSDSTENEYSAPPTMPSQPMPMGDCYNFSDLESQLFSGGEGQKTLARIITRMRIEGYDEDAWKVVIGLTAYAYKNYNCKGMSIMQQLQMLESAPLREITQYVPGDIGGLVESVLQADTLNLKSPSMGLGQNKEMYKIVALALTAVAFSFATRR